MSSNRPKAQALPPHNLTAPQLHYICSNLQPLASYQVDNETWFAYCNQIISAMYRISNVSDPLLFIDKNVVTANFSLCLSATLQHQSSSELNESN
jgi:hypothetical protein